MDCLTVAADETAAKVNVLEVVFFGLEVGDLTDVVAVRLEVSGMDLEGVWEEKCLPDCVEQTSGYVLGCKHAALANVEFAV